MRKPVFLMYTILLIALSVPSFGQTITCAECGMKSDLSSRFTARLVLLDRAVYFCDVGDLFAYLNRKKPSNVLAAVRDYLSGEWTDAHNAFYVRSKKKFQTPMGWSIAAFKNKVDADGFGSAMDYQSVRRTVQ